MIYELVYTSAPAGLRPGSSGYSTVQSSRGIPAPTVDLLESLSGYRHVFTAGTPAAAKNPVNFGHYLLRVQGRVQHVLSRVSDCPLDHTGRSNKLGHHLVLDQPEAVPAGPAWLLQQPGWMIDRWDGEVKTLNTVRKPPQQARPAAICQHWHRVTGDAGWAGVVAEAFLEDPQRKVFFIYQPGLELLTLIEEALALLPPSRRWEVTFATYGAALPATVDCLWSGVLAGSQEEHFSKRFVNALRIDLTKPAGPVPQNGPLIALARTGKTAVTPPTAHPPVASLPPHLSPPPAPAASRPIQPPRSGSAPATPIAPPATRAVRKPQSDTFKLILAVILSCLLFGGGTVAAIVYMTQQQQPILTAQASPLDLSPTTTELAPQPPLSAAPAPTSTPAPEAPQAPTINPQDTNSLPENPTEKMAADSDAATTPDIGTAEESTQKGSTVLNPLSPNQLTDEKPGSKSNIQQEIRVIYPEQSAFLGKSKTTMMLPRTWSNESDEPMSIDLLMPIINDSTPGEGVIHSWKEVSPQKHPIEKTYEPDENSVYKNYDSHQFTLSDSKNSHGTVSVLSEHGHPVKAVFSIQTKELYPFVFNSLLAIRYKDRTIAVPFRSLLLIGPVKTASNNSAKLAFDFPPKSEFIEVFKQLTPPEILSISEEVIVSAGRDYAIPMKQALNHPSEVRLGSNDFLEITYHPHNVKVIDGAKNSPIKLNVLTIDFSKGLSLKESLVNKNKEIVDSMAGRWGNIKSKYNLRNESFPGCAHWEFLDSSKKGSLENDEHYIKMLCDRLIDISKTRSSNNGSNQSVDSVLEYCNLRVQLVTSNKRIEEISDALNNASVVGLSICNKYLNIDHDGRKDIIQVPVFSIDSSDTKKAVK